MPYFIKTGYWEKLSRAPKGFLNLDLVSGGGGGSISADIYAVVDGSGFPINSGETEIILPVGFGPRIRVFRNNVLLDFGDQGLGDPYYDYDSATRTVTLSVPTSPEEKFVFMSY